MRYIIEFNSKFYGPFPTEYDAKLWIEAFDDIELQRMCVIHRLLEV